MKEHQLDWNRRQRIGFPEIIFGESKSASQIEVIIGDFISRKENLLVTRVCEEKAQHLKSHFKQLHHVPLARTLRWEASVPQPLPFTVGVVAAGTSDACVAAEAVETLHFLGLETKVVCDVGVAGIHRLFEALPELSICHVLIAIAGFEGALPSVLGGLLPQPIIAVPTSVGYGVAREGHTALHAMLSSCASGLTVVNIDNGFGAAMATFRMLRGSAHERS